MLLAPLADAPLIIQTHALAALAALLLGPVVLLRQQRDLWHRAAGAIWALLMLLVAVSGLFIHEIAVWGPFSPVHLFSLITFAGLAAALRAAWRHDFAAHGRAMRALYTQALILPGLFTLLPGRRLQAMFGPDTGMVPFVVACVLAVCLIAAIWFHPALARSLRSGDKNPLFKLRQYR